MGAPMSDEQRLDRTASGPALAEREPDAGVLTCSACGCRLTARERTAGIGPDAAWRHFAGGTGRDARGCRVDCVDEPHTMASVFRAAA